MAAKLCPRCDAQYTNLKSTTCPQCFAKLLEVDDATAAELAEERSQIEQSPEFQEAKSVDDEQFKEQSFGACLGVVAIVCLTLLLSVIFIVMAVRRHGQPALRITHSVSAPTLTDPMTPLPIADATLDAVMPATIGTFHRTAMDEDVVLPGTLTHIYHAVYVSGNTGPALDVSAIRSGSPTTEQNTFRLGVTLAAKLDASQKRTTLIFATEHWRYAVIGPSQSTGSSPVTEEFRAAVANQFKG